MNAMISQYEEQEFDYQQAFRRNGSSQRSTSFGESQQPKLGRQRGKTPQKFNGIHRRRRKKAAW